MSGGFCPGFFVLIPTTTYLAQSFISSMNLILPTFCQCFYVVITAELKLLHRVGMKASHFQGLTAENRFHFQGPNTRQIKKIVILEQKET